MKRTLLILVTLTVLAACGGGYGSGGGNRVYSGPPPTATVTTIDVNLESHATTNTPYGTSTGYAPPVSDVNTGSFIQFHNSDNDTHTATLIAGNPPQFPAADPFTNAAVTQSGTRISSGFTSGALTGGASSQLIFVDQSGVYLFGCFFHYASNGMRAAIVVNGSPQRPPAGY